MPSSSWSPCDTTGPLVAWLLGRPAAGLDVAARAQVRVLVTGHEGYIGSVLTDTLLRDGLDVVGLDAGLLDGCDLGEPPRAVPALRKDLRDVRVEDLHGVDAVVHLAGLSNDPLGEIAPSLTMEINGEHSVRLAELARRAGSERFVFFSSCSVYGRGGDEPLDEDSPLRPQTAYARSKIAAERGIHALAADGFSPVSMRNATVYGCSPRMRFDLVVNNLVGWAHTTGEVRLDSDGSAWRPLIHVRDLCRAAAAVLRAPRESVHDQVLNVGSDEQNHAVGDIAEAVRRELPGTRVVLGLAGPDSRSYRVDFSRAARLLPGLSPAWTLAAGIGEIAGELRRLGVTLEEFRSRRFSRLAQVRHLLAAGRLGPDLRP